MDWASSLKKRTYFHKNPKYLYVFVFSQPEWRSPHAVKMSQVITVQTSACKRSVSLKSIKSIKHTCKSVADLYKMMVEEKRKLGKSKCLL